MYIKADSGNYVARLFYVPVWGQVPPSPGGQAPPSPPSPGGQAPPSPGGENWGLTWSPLQVLYSVQDRKLIINIQVHR